MPGEPWVDAALAEPPVRAWYPPPTSEGWRRRRRAYLCVRASPHHPLPRLASCASRVRAHVCSPLVTSASAGCSLVALADSIHGEALVGEEVSERLDDVTGEEGEVLLEAVLHRRQVGCRRRGAQAWVGVVWCGWCACERRSGPVRAMWCVFECCVRVHIEFILASGADSSKQIIKHETLRAHFAHVFEPEAFS